MTAHNLKLENVSDTGAQPKLDIEDLANSLVDRLKIRNSLEAEEYSYVERSSDSLTPRYLEKVDYTKLTEIITRAKRPVSTFNFVAMQEWEGYVTEIKEDTFTAILVDVTKKDNEPTEEADFEMDEISNSDKKLLKIGSVFRWAIGYNTSGSTKMKSSFVVFRNLPAYSKKELAAAQTKAESLSKSINWT